MTCVCGIYGCRHNINPRTSYVTYEGKDYAIIIARGSILTVRDKATGKHIELDMDDTAVIVRKTSLGGKP